MLPLLSVLPVLVKLQCAVCASSPFRRSFLSATAEGSCEDRQTTVPWETSSARTVAFLGSLQQQHLIRPQSETCSPLLRVKTYQSYSRLPPGHARSSALHPCSSPIRPFLPVLGTLRCAASNEARIPAPDLAECTVYLVGSGVGSVEFLTTRAKELLENADAVVYDALADGDLLSLVPASCQRYFVGKRGGAKGTSTKQEDIEQLLVRLADSQRGLRTVVRLKAGDPFIFGRSKGECLALQKAGVGFEVVPGLSSAVAGPLLAGVALTDPELSSCFAVLTASEVGAAFPRYLKELSGADTLVFLMGASRLDDICAALQEAGRAPHTPVAVIKWAGHRDKQQEWAGTLQTIAQLTAGASLSPAVIVVGATAAQQLATPLSAAPSASAPAGASTGSARREPAAAASAEGAKAGAARGSGGGDGGSGEGRLMDEADCFLLDMDGVLWAGGVVIAGAVEAVERLRAAGKRVLFVTNNSSKSRAQVARTLQGFGFQVSPDDVVTSGWAAARFLSTHQPKVTRAYVIGAEGLRDELAAAGVHAVTCEEDGLDEEGFAALELDSEVQAVVSGWDVRFSWRKLAVAGAYLQQEGMLFVGTNPDTANRVGARMMPENGAQLAALEAVAGRKATIAGKPSALLVQTLVKRYGLDPARTVMVGDRLDTDIEFGNTGGLKTALVLTGVVKEEEVAVMAAEGWAGVPEVQRPDFLLPDILAAVTGQGAVRVNPPSRD